MSGNTPDISKFRFKFWEPICEPTAKFLDIGWKKGRFIGFAENIGDPFTYKIWTISGNEDWTDGRELVRNIVIRRQTGTQPPANLPSTFTNKNLLALETGLTRQKTKQHKQDSWSKSVCNKRATKASTHKYKQSGANTTDPSPRLPAATQKALDDSITLATADLTDDKSMDDPLSHTIPLSSTINREDVPIQLTGGEDDNDVSDVSDIDMVEETNNEFEDAFEHSIERILSIEDHKWKDGQLLFRVLLETDKHSWEWFQDLKEDIPRELAAYMVKRDVKRSKHDPKLQWAKKTNRDSGKSKQANRTDIWSMHQWQRRSLPHQAQHKGKHKEKEEAGQLQ